MKPSIAALLGCSFPAWESLRLSRAPGVRRGRAELGKGGAAVPPLLSRKRPPLVKKVIASKRLAKPMVSWGGLRGVGFLPPFQSPAPVLGQCGRRGEPPLPLYGQVVNAWRRFYSHSNG